MDLIQDAMEFARSVFSGDSGGHDYDHTLRVYRMALRIAREENADLETVALAALLHDVDDRKLSPETCEDLGRARAFLTGCQYPPERTERVLHILSQVSFSAGRVPDTLEGKCVQDADRLDAMGAIGIARTFAYGGSKGRPLHDPAGQDPSTSVQHFYDKLLRLKAMMNTDSGRRLAAPRHEFLETFLEEFLREWEEEV